MYFYLHCQRIVLEDFLDYFKVKDLKEELIKKIRIKRIILIVCKMQKIKILE